MSSGEQVVVRAIKTQQAGGIDVYAFFLAGSDLLRIAEIPRIEREDGDLKGFQRKEIRSHINEIVSFLDSGPVLFPNAVILALSPEVEFKLSRGPRPEGMQVLADGGVLAIPVRPEGRRSAWIVDGQQRSLALSRTKNKDLPVPVVAFVSADTQTQREQFILVNKVKPLPTRLIDELLPEVSAMLPRGLAARKLPSELVNALNKDPRSPFHKLIKRESSSSGEGAVADTALVEAIKQNLKPPMGALSQYLRETSGGSDTEGMYQALVLYWTAVRDAFPDAWGKPPQASRLMHSAGIRAVGELMNTIMLRAEASAAPQEEVRASLARLAPHCAWTSGSWEGLELGWKEVQSTPQDIKALRDYLIGLDRELSRGGR